MPKNHLAAGQTKTPTFAGAVLLAFQGIKNYERQGL